MTNELPGMQDKSAGGQTDCDKAAKEKMREDFETEVLKAEGHIGKLPCKTYSDPITASAWWAWQACAARSAETIARLEEELARERAMQRLYSQKFDDKQMELAAAQADNARLRAVLSDLARGQLQVLDFEKYVCSTAKAAISQPLDMSALDAYVADAKRGVDADMAIDSMFGLPPAPDKQGEQAE